jgi:hypothetical protein
MSLIEFTLEAKIESVAQGGDTLVKGAAVVTALETRRDITTSSVLTAAEKRGGKTLSSVQDTVAANLAKKAAKIARGE